MKSTKLPLFPKLSFLEPHHQVEINKLIESNHLYSDYNFISLWSWDHQRQLQLCTLNNNLVIRFQEYLDTSDFFYSFIGTNEVDKTAKELILHSSKENKPALKLIPEFVIENLKNPLDFTITEDRDNFDYILAARDTIELKGHSASKRRNFNKIMREKSEDINVQEMDIGAGETYEHILELFDNWSKQVSNNDEYKNNELKAIKKLLDQSKSINTENLHVIGLFVEGKFNAFSISEVLQNGTAMGHFKKAARDYTGLGIALDYFTAKTLEQKGVSHINHEQDMGIEGLRHAKMSSNPVYFLKKFTLSLAS